MTEFEIALLKELKRIGDSLEKIAASHYATKSSETKERNIVSELQQVANEIDEYEPAVARLLMEYIK